MSLLDISTTDDNEDTCKCKARKLACKNDTDFAAWRDKLIHDGLQVYRNGTRQYMTMLTLVRRS